MSHGLARHRAVVHGPRPRPAPMRADARRVDVDERTDDRRARQSAGPPARRTAHRATQGA